MMKKKLLKSLMFIVMLTCVCLCLGICASAKTVTSGDFVFDVNSKSATLTKYTGSDTAVTVPSKVSSVNVTVIGPEAFWKNQTLQTISLPSTLTQIGAAAFNECSSLKKVVIPSKVTTIGDGAFWYCTSLESVVIPKSVTKIGDKAFRGCTKLTAYTVKGSYGETYIKSLDDVKLAYRYATSVTLSSKSLSVAVGSSSKLTATLAPTPLYYTKLDYSSSDSKVATVDSSGNIKGVAVGTATITVTTKDGSKKSASCTVTVVPAKVKTIKYSTLTVSSAKITWTKVSGATGYKLYKYDPSAKKYICISTTTSLSYTDKTAKIGETLKYRVRAYTKKSNKYYYGPYSSVLTVTMPAPGLVKDLKAAASTNYVKLSWGKADTATGYRVYQYDPAKKQYVKKTTTTALSATIKSLTPNSEYTFLIKSYYKDSKGTVTWSAKYEKTVIATRPLAVSDFCVVAGSESFDRLTFKWQAVSGVTGYQISCVPESGESIIKTIAGGDITQYTIDGLDYGMTYTVKIRAYTTRSTGNTLSYYCTAITAQTVSMPGTADEAFNSFVAALNATKCYNGNSALYKSLSTGNFTGENRDKYQLVLDNAFRNASDIHVFTSGIDSENKKPTDYINPTGSDCALTQDNLVADSLSYSGNGSGYDITFEITGENAMLLCEAIDTQAIAKVVDNFSLTSCDYKSVKVSAKVQSGLISHMTISQDVEVSFKIGVRSYSYTQTVETTYAFIKF